MFLSPIFFKLRDTSTLLLSMSTKFPAPFISFGVYSFDPKTPSNQTLIYPNGVSGNIKVKTSSSLHMQPNETVYQLHSLTYINDQMEMSTQMHLYKISLYPTINLEYCKNITHADTNQLDISSLDYSEGYMFYLLFNQTYAKIVKYSAERDTFSESFVLSAPNPAELKYSLKFFIWRTADSNVTVWTQFKDKDLNARGDFKLTQNITIVPIDSINAHPALDIDGATLTLETMESRQYYQEFELAPLEIKIENPTTQISSKQYQVKGPITHSKYSYNLSQCKKVGFNQYHTNMELG